MQKTPYVFPIIGGRKVEHLLANIEALEITLSNDHIKYLESVVPFEPGFPYWMIVSYVFPFTPHGHFILFQGDGQENTRMLAATSAIAKGPLLQPLRP